MSEVQFVRICYTEDLNMYTQSSIFLFNLPQSLYNFLTYSSLSGRWALVRGLFSCNLVDFCPSDLTTPPAVSTWPSSFTPSTLSWWSFFGHSVWCCWRELFSIAVTGRGLSIVTYKVANVPRIWIVCVRWCVVQRRVEEKFSHKTPPPKFFITILYMLTILHLLRWH